MLSLFLYLNAAHRNLAEEKVVLNHEIFLKIFLLQTSLKAERLTVWNGDLAMEGVATAHAEILMFVRGFSIEVCTDLAMLKVDRCVQNREFQITVYGER